MCFVLILNYEGQKSVVMLSVQEVKFFSSNKTQFLIS